MEVRIEGIDGLKHGESRVFDFPRKGRTEQGFLIRFEDGFYAYLNQCRHWPVSLDLGDNDFFSTTADRIMCKTHGAVYHPATGYCEFGPCARAELERFSVAISSNAALVNIPDSESA